MTELQTRLERNFAPHSPPPTPTSKSASDRAPISAILLPVTDILTTIALVFAPVDDVLTPVPYIFASVTNVFTPVAYILHAITKTVIAVTAVANVLHSVADVFTLVPHVFAPVATVFVPVSNVLAPVPHILTAVCDVLNPVTNDRPFNRSLSAGNCSDSNQHRGAQRRHPHTRHEILHALCVLVRNRAPCMRGDVRISVALSDVSKRFICRYC